MIEKRDYWLWLTTIPGITKKDVSKLLSYNYTPYLLFREKSSIVKDLFRNIKRVNVKYRDFINSRHIESLETYKKSLEKLGIDYITIDDEDYFSKLHDLYDKVYVLYFIGRLPKNKINISIVGARKCTHYGRSVAKKFARELASKGVNIISGLALGVDSAAHLGALEAGGCTSAVLGNSLDICYPAENKNLMKKIARNGVLFSEYPLKTTPTRYTFPLRNRIISALSDGILLVEARKKSGSLITLNHGLDIGRDIFVAPLDILGKSNEGGNQAIRDGAKVVFNVEDILEEYYSVVSNKITTTTNQFQELEEDERIVFSCINYNPLNVEEIIVKTGLSVQKVQYLLLKLEMKRLIVSLPNNRYSLEV